jgi:hypothetical protein
MKNIILSILSCSVLFLLSCGNGNTPKSTAEDFLNALQNLDDEKCKKMCTVNGYNEAQQFISANSYYTEQIGDAIVKIVDENIVGELSTITYKVEKFPKSTYTLTLLKVDDIWKVDNISNPMTAIPIEETYLENVEVDIDLSDTSFYNPDEVLPTSDDEITDTTIITEEQLNSN